MISSWFESTRAVNSPRFSEPIGTCIPPPRHPSPAARPPCAERLPLAPFIGRLSREVGAGVTNGRRALAACRLPKRPVNGGGTERADRAVDRARSFAFVSAAGRRHRRRMTELEIEGPVV